MNQAEDIASGVDSQTVFIGRAALNVLSESQLGVIATQGDPQSNLSNHLIGADFRYLNSNLPGGKIVESEFWYQQTDTEGISGEDAAYGFGIRYPNRNGLRGGYRYKHIGNNFDPALGFVNQQGIEDHALDFGYAYFLSQGSYARSVYGGFDGYRNIDSNTGELIAETVDLRINVSNNTGDSINAAVVREHEFLSRDFTIYRASDGSRNIVIPPGDYSFVQGSAGISFAGRRRVSGGISVNVGDYFGGDRFQRRANINWQPGNKYNLSLSYTENDIRLPQGNFTVRQSTVNVLVNLSLNLSWANRIQYDNVSEGVGINSRLHWLPEAGKEAFLVLNWGLVDLDKDNNFDSINSDLSLKFNYTFRF